ncbi:DUF2913 family protein, partial [Shewanella sairae]|uniref:DUF2913 family protein n=1 Tax=Shewanella sairae TaxID=190310 RepID=UPI001C805B13
MNSCDIFSDVLDRALIHLYLTVAETNRFVPKPKRNEILVQFIKPTLKNKYYQSAKKDIRSLVLLGRNATCDLESKLVELRDLSLRYDKNASDAKQLFNLLSLIESELNLLARFLSILNGREPLPNVIYLLQEHVENGFIVSGEQVAPVSLFLESDKVTTLVDFINGTGLFLA